MKEGYCTRCKAITEYTQNGSEENICRQIAGPNYSELSLNSVSCTGCNTTFIGGSKIPYHYFIGGNPQDKANKNQAKKERAIA